MRKFWITFLLPQLTPSVIVAAREVAHDESRRAERVGGGLPVPISIGKCQRP